MSAAGKARATAVVVCPGRGSYNRDELGYLARYHGARRAMIEEVDAYRAAEGQATISELDGADRYETSRHATGDNASALIFACALADFAAIERERFDIVAVTGNSMGWYLALACAGALSFGDGLRVVNTMGGLMHSKAPGGQLLFPLVDENWRADAALREACDAASAAAADEAGVEIYRSIDLGGLRVIAANREGIAALKRQLPQVQQRYPMVLPFHGAFHSPLMEPIAAEAREILTPALFRRPELPLIDGRGEIWQPYRTELEALHDYTFGHQVCRTYDYSAAIEVAVKEFAPEHLILLGPGASLGPPTAQVLINERWLGLNSKQDFAELQERDPFILSMGIEAQRARAV